MAGIMPTGRHVKMNKIWFLPSRSHFLVKKKGIYYGKFKNRIVLYSTRGTIPGSRGQCQERLHGGAGGIDADS